MYPAFPGSHVTQTPSLHEPAPASRSPGLAARVSAALVAVAAFCALAGWTLDWPLLKSLGQAVPMNPTTALCFMLCGGSIALQQWRTGTNRPPLIGRCLALAVVLVGAMKGTELCFGFETGVDQLLFRSRLAGNR